MCSLLHTPYQRLDRHIGSVRTNIVEGEHIIHSHIQNDTENKCGIHRT
jgi:hypothetical protein